MAGREDSFGARLDQLARRGEAGTDSGHLQEQPGQVLVPRAEQGHPPTKEQLEGPIDGGGEE